MRLLELTKQSDKRTIFEFGEGSVVGVGGEEVDKLKVFFHEQTLFLILQGFSHEMKGGVGVGIGVGVGVGVGGVGVGDHWRRSCID